jgi:uncharacterized protein YecT (DUF1311 family)
MNRKRGIVMASLVIVIGLYWLASLGLQPGFASGAPAQDQNPCRDPQTQKEINACAVREYKEADTELNKTYRQVIAQLRNDQKTQLGVAQKAWIKFKDAQCAFESMDARGGSMYQTLYYGCLTSVTRSRTIDLKRVLETMSKR